MNDSFGVIPVVKQNKKISFCDREESKTGKKNSPSHQLLRNMSPVYLEYQSSNQSKKNTSKRNSNQESQER
eukprot:CAMPEP_0170548940 /NCGR_PEP_ID=MMETSP0211-20121228/7112_1 /TAXON_ID=311385 /ORGANISM="Pseudokeronopsis sp., Strain OXSARD2" /LENGTH=70 /DNA_ID=CAMNT_0010854665 /DNA_START=1252 /DNA_END=1464 /DNA_ORIENTATION=+